MSVTDGTPVGEAFQGQILLGALDLHARPYLNVPVWRRPAAESVGVVTRTKAIVETDHFREAGQGVWSERAEVAGLEE